MAPPLSHDITAKDFTDVVAFLSLVVIFLLSHTLASTTTTTNNQVGDLNVVSLILVAVHFTYSAKMGTDALAMQFTGFADGVLCQFLAPQRPQSHEVRGGGAAVGGRDDTAKDHRSHHTPPHETDFCPIGVMNPPRRGSSHHEPPPLAGRLRRHERLRRQSPDVLVQRLYLHQPAGYDAQAPDDPVDQATNATS